MTSLSPRALLATLAALVVGLALLLTLSTRRHEAPKERSVAMRTMTPRQLEAFGRSAGHPIFWAGKRASATVQAGRSAGGSLVVQYADGLTIATYPMPDAADNLRRQAQRDDGLELATIADGRLILIDRERGNTAYLAASQSDEQVEIHSASGEDALRLAVAGRIVACCGS